MYNHSLNINVQNDKIHFSEFKLVVCLIVVHRNDFNLSMELFTKQIVQQNLLTYEKFNKDDLIAKLEEIKNKVLIKSDDVIFKRVFSNDIDKLKNIIEQEKQRFDLSNLLDISRIAMKRLNVEFGENVTEMPDIYIVDDFPEPFTNITTWDFMFVGIDDNLKYNIRQGLYLHKDRQFPLFSEYLIIHEFVHYFIDKIKKDSLVKYRWIEEAIANWFSLVVHYGHFKDIGFINFIKSVNHLYNNIFPNSVIAEYSQYDDMFRKLYRLGGAEAISKFCKEYFLSPSDEKWEVLLYDLAHNNFGGLKEYVFPHCHQNEFDLALCESSTESSFLNLSCTEFIILKNINSEKFSFDNLSIQADIEIGILRKGVSKLQNRGYLIVEDGQIEVIDNIVHLVKSGLIKINQL